jgi:hypothetical protein
MTPASSQPRLGFEFFNHTPKETPVSTIRSNRHLAAAFAAVLALDLAGLIVAVATNLTATSHAIGSGTPLSSPIPFVAAQALLVTAALRASRRLTTAAAATLVAVLGMIAIASGFADGSYMNGGLTAPDRALQVALSVALGVMSALALARAARTRRVPVRAA